VFDGSKGSARIVLTLETLSGSALPREDALSDARILSGVRAGDPAVALALHKRIRPVVGKMVQRLVGFGDADLDDLIQVALIEVVTSIDSFRGDCTLEAWTSRVTAHVVYKALRRRKLERLLFERADDNPDDAETADPDAASPHNHAEAAQHRSVLRRIRWHLAQMNEDRATAFWLHDVLGYELSELAHILDASVAAVQSRLVRGRADLHKRLAADPDVADALHEGGIFP
jgi:RNA polymerase sigma-70 factor (ECF subfamily)